MTSPPRVLVADDHVPTRAGVRMALEHGGIEVCAEASTAAEAVEEALRTRPDLCLLDVHMPGGGSAAASTITTRLPGSLVIMLTVSVDGDDLIEALRRGASGYLLKDMDPTQLPDLVRGALKGESIVPGSLIGRLVDEVRGGSAGPRGLAVRAHGGRPLTARELEVLDLLHEGAGTAEIAERLFVSRVTVRRHVSNILDKLGVTSRQDALRLLDS